ncbi:MAG: Flp pilus assembly complex ATPase component TadA [Planctomycetes bacterium]|nr:Flp pilus assembly complex ATPase component TadA [Planctomycetota bacterium]
MRGRQVGRVLIKMGVLSRNKVGECLKIQADNGGTPKLGEILVEQGLIDPGQLQQALAAQRGMEFISLDGMEIPADVLDKVPAQIANTYRVVPIDYNSATNELVVAVDDPDNLQATDDLSTLMGFKVKAKVTDANALAAALATHYEEKEDDAGGADASINELIHEIQGDNFLAEFEGRDQSIDLDELQELSQSNPVRKLLNLVLLQAIRDKASDIHFEPFEDEYKMRYRIDGVLYEMIPPPKYIAAALSSRIKVMADLDIAERRLPQDGRISLTVSGKPVDLRVSVLPTMFGESVVLRILDRSQVSFDMEKLGFSDHDLNTYRQLIKKPNGIVIVTGPTGCGKTTTLYAAVNALNDIGTKIITTEDPVEYDLDGVVQVQIRSDVGLTFATCLRSILRQDPDIVLVGEVRDLETAKIAAQASLTGHLVLTTLHTNDAPSSVARLLDLGVEPFLITATVEGVVAQRLVRKICTKCRTEYEPDDDQLFELRLDRDQIKDKTLYYGKGCNRCNNTGYKGRLGLYEIMTFSDSIRNMIMEKASTNLLRDEAVKNGMILLRENGLSAIYDGITTVDEVIKETIASTE